MDGVGLAYSYIYVVDLTTGEFAGGSPFRAEADEDAQQPIAEMRAKTREAAKAELATLDVIFPGEIEALSGDGVIGPATTMRFGLPVYTPPGATEGDYTLSLETFDLKLSETCQARIDNRGKGFALSITRRWSRSASCTATSRCRNGGDARPTTASTRSSCRTRKAISPTALPSSQPIRSISRARAAVSWSCRSVKPANSSYQAFASTAPWPRIAAVGWEPA